MGHYRSEMMSQDEIDQENREQAERKTWQEAGYKYRGGSYRMWDTLVCPHAACVVDIHEWRKHEEFHEKLEKTDG